MSKIPDALDLAREALDEAESEINAVLDSSTPEWRALHALHSALSYLRIAIRENRDSTARAANVASCLANGIQPD
jgi:hypothetical protein